MQRSLRLFLKRGVILSVLTAICCIVVTLGLVQSATTTQAAKRSFENKIPSHVPLKIKIKKEKEERALDLNNKNWFRDIEIEVTNTSDKPVYFLSMFVEMPDLPQDRPGVIKVFLLSYGRGEFFEQNTKPIPDDIPIEPKTTFTFVLNENEIVGYEKWRTRNNSKEPLKLEIWLNHLSYGDGTGFTTLGALPFPFKNNPEELGHCLPKPRPPEFSARACLYSSSLHPLAAEEAVEEGVLDFAVNVPALAEKAFALKA